MITQTQLRAFYEAQKAVKTFQVQLRAMEEIRDKLEAELVDQLTAPERIQRGRLTARIEKHQRRNVPYKEIAINLGGKEQVEAMVAAIAPTLTDHIVIEASA